MSNIQKRDILAGYIPGFRPYVDFSAATLIWQDATSSDGLSPDFELEIGHVVRCGDDLFILACIRYYFSSLTEEELSSSDDVLFSFGRYGYVTVYYFNSLYSHVALLHTLHLFVDSISDVFSWAAKSGNAQKGDLVKQAYLLSSLRSHCKT